MIRRFDFGTWRSIRSSKRLRPTRCQGVCACGVCGCWPLKRLLYAVCVYLQTVFQFQVIANYVHCLACMVVVCRAVAFSPDGSLLGVGFGGRIGGAVLKQKDGAHAILRADTLETVHQVRCRACYWQLFVLCTWLPDHVLPVYCFMKSFAFATALLLLLLLLRIIIMHKSECAVFMCWALCRVVTPSSGSRK